MSKMKERKKDSSFKKVSKKVSKMVKREENEVELLVETVDNLKDVVNTMGAIFEEMDSEFKEEVVDKRTFTEKMQSKLPKKIMSKKVREQEKDRERISSAYKRLKIVTGTLDKVAELSKQRDTDWDALTEAYFDTQFPEPPSGKGKVSDKQVKQFEKAIDEMRGDFLAKMEGMNNQILLMKASIGDMTELLQDQGVVIEGIDVKVDEINVKLDKTQKMLRKISRQITGNRVMMALMAGAVIGTLAVVIL